ncbi:MAG: hypothetical protein ABEJ80_07200 [Halarchaeum sp.]
MDDATAFEFKLLGGGIGLLVTGALLLTAGDPFPLLGVLVLAAGALLFLGGFTDQSGRFADE